MKTNGLSVLLFLSTLAISSAAPRVISADALFPVLAKRSGGAVEVRNDSNGGGNACHSFGESDTARMGFANVDAVVGRGCER